MRTRFFRRFAAIALVVLICAAVGFATVVSLVLSRVGVGAAPPAAVLFTIAAAVAVPILLMVAVVRRVGAPLGVVMEAADRVADGDYDVRVPETGSPPVRALARAFNTMTTRLQANDRLRRDLMADIAHELRTPLTIIQGRLEGLLDGVYPRDDAQVRDLLGEAHVLARLVEDLRTLALSESGALHLEREPTDIAALAADTVRTASATAGARHVELSLAAADRLQPLNIDPVRIREVLSNLLANAIRHSHEGGRVEVELRDRERGGVEVAVRDRGRGMTPDVLAHVFDRFYKDCGSRGSGLGLTIAKNLVAAHGGDISATSAVGEGTTITFWLPPDL